jgi:hypothetical protein
MSQTDPRMNATPASTKSWWRISAAAIRLPISPVMEIAFGVSLDQAVPRELPHLRGGADAHA